MSLINPLLGLLTWKSWHLQHVGIRRVVFYRLFNGYAVSVVHVHGCLIFDKVHLLWNLHFNFVHRPIGHLVIKANFD